jgi:hypothetical protein
MNGAAPVVTRGRGAAAQRAETKDGRAVLPASPEK